MDTPAIMGLVIVRRNVRIEPLTRAEAIRALADLAADMASTQAAKAQGGLDWVRDDRQLAATRLSKVKSQARASSSEEAGGDGCDVRVQPASCLEDL
jgi:hypothetical protein